MLSAFLAEVLVTDIGISETTRVSLNILNDLARLERLAAPWAENRDMIVALFTPIFERSWQCPDLDNARGCQTEGSDIHRALRRATARARGTERDFPRSFYFGQMIVKPRSSSGHARPKPLANARARSSAFDTAVSTTISCLLGHCCCCL